MDNKFSKMLLFMRLSVFLVMFMWTLDKFVRPEHAQAVFEHYYMAPEMGLWAMYLFGAIEMAVIVSFLVGFQKDISYGLVLLFHTISTFSAYEMYLAPFAGGSQLLFFAAWPMLATCLFLYLYRDKDKMLQIF